MNRGSSWRPKPGPGQVVSRLAGGWLLEPRRGYRFSPELELLPRMVQGLPMPRLVVDLGCGAGAMTLACSRGLFARVTAHGAGLERPEGAVPPRHAGRRAGAAVGRVRFVGVDYQAEALGLARANLIAWGIEPDLVLADLRASPIAAGVADLVLANPPHFPAGWGRESSNPGRHGSTHELRGGVREFMAEAARLLTPGGWAVVLYHPDRLTDLLLATAAAGLVADQVWFVRHMPRDKVLRLFLLATRGPRPRGLRVEEVTMDFEAMRRG